MSKIVKITEIFKKFFAYSKKVRTFATQKLQKWQRKIKKQEFRLF